MPEPFDLDAYTDSLSMEPFKFRLAGQDRELPNFSSLSIQQGLDIEAGALRRVLEDVTSDDELARLILDLPGAAANQLIQKWMRQAAVKPGESRASSRS